MSEHRLRIMHVVFSLETGGLENGVVNLCNRLDPDRFRPSICVFRGGGALATRLDSRRVEYLMVKRHGRYDPTLPFRLAWHMRQHRIDIVHTHSWGTLVEGITAAIMAPTPTIIHGEHGVMEARSRNVPIQRWLWSRAHQITAVAEPLAERMASVVGFPRDRIQVIPNGVDTDRFRPRKPLHRQGRQPFGLPSEGIVIGTVARLVTVKNHMGVLQALARLKAPGIHATLALAGDGPLRDELQKLAHDLQLAEQVHFLGEIDKVEAFLNTLDVFVLNSHSEGMSNTLLEAMACGVPVVATAVGTNPTLVADGKSGYLVPAGDVASLARALTGLARDDRLRQTMGAAGRRFIERFFSIDNMVREYSQLYHTLGTRRTRDAQPCIGATSRRQSSPSSVEVGQVE